MSQPVQRHYSSWSVFHLVGVRRTNRKCFIARLEPVSCVVTYLERDVRHLLAVRDVGLFQRCLKLCAARCGQLVNLSSLATDCGISHVTPHDD